MAPKIRALAIRVAPTMPRRPKTPFTTSLRTTNAGRSDIGRLGFGLKPTIDERRGSDPRREPVHIVQVAELFQDGQTGAGRGLVSGDPTALRVCASLVWHRAGPIPDRQRSRHLGRVSIGKRPGPPQLSFEERNANSHGHVKTRCENLLRNLLAPVDGEASTVLRQLVRVLAGQERIVRGESTHLVDVKVPASQPGVRSHGI